MQTANIFARAGSVLTFGNGGWDLTIGGSNTTINVGDGPVNLFDRYADNTFVVGNGTHNLTLIGTDDRITVGTGRTTLDAPGGHDTIAVAGGTVDIDAAGWNDQILIGAATSTINIATLDDVVVTAARLGTAIGESGVQDRVTFLKSSSADLRLGLGSETVTLVGNAAGAYRGTIDLTGLADNKVILQGIRGLTSFADVEDHLKRVMGGSQLALPGGGDIMFVGAHPTAANFGFAP